MRQAIGSTWIMQLVIVFMLIFVAFLALTINYTKAYKIKNEVTSILEKYEGPNSRENGSIAIINNYLKYNGYRSVGTCEEDSFGAASLDSSTLVSVTKGDKYYYCIRRVNTSTQTFPNRASYELETFFKFNLPLLGDIFTFRVTGETIDINWPSDDITSDYEYYDLSTWSSDNTNQNSVKPSGGSSGSNNKIYYTVSFNLAGGTSEKRHGGSSVAPSKGIASQKVLAGGSVTKPSDPYYYTTSRGDAFDHGATFVGWTLNGVPYDFSTPVNSNITLKANWVSNVEVKINVSGCGFKEYDEDRNRTWTQEGISLTHRFPYGEILGNNFIVYDGPRYGDNQSNHEYNYQYSFGHIRPIKYWTVNGKRFDLNTPLTSDITLNAVC